MDGSSKKEITISTIASFIVSMAAIIPILWFVGKPLISNALAEDIQKTVQTEIKPLNNAFIALMRKDVSQLRKQIAAMEYRRDNPPDDDWTQEDAERLVELREELEATQSAIAALKSS